MSLPKTPVGLMTKVYSQVFPEAHRELSKWRTKAMLIPNPELRQQALASIDTKSFHCEGGSILGLISQGQLHEAIRFIVAYQTISDYLDNLCDRSNSMDPLDFEYLHLSMKHALTPGAEQINYYQYREDQNDNGYLSSLVSTCQQQLMKVSHYPIVSSVLHELCGYYCELQIHKHVQKDERVSRLEKWHTHHKADLPQDLNWYEFGACAGSTLGIFCLISYAFRTDFSIETTNQIRKGYFPYVQGLHILLDYFIDQEEDKVGGDLNFCSYYESESKLMDRLCYFAESADQQIRHMPDWRFHRMINHGLLGLYLSDEKVSSQENVHALSKKIVKIGGPSSSFFYWNARAIRTWQKKQAK